MVWSGDSHIEDGRVKGLAADGEVSVGDRDELI